METKSDITDPASVMKREGEGKEWTSESWDITVNQFPPEEMNKAEPWVNQPPDAITFLEKSEDIPVATNIEVENVDAFIKGNVGTLEGENFLRSLSVANVTCEKTSILADDCQAAEILNQAEKLVPKNETIWEEKLEDQHVEIVANEEASPEENHQNTKEELGGSEKDEKGVMISDEKSETEYNTQTLEMLEATSGQNAEACDREESTETALGSNTASIEEGLREVSFQEEAKESETSFNSVGKEMDAEAIQLSTITEDNKNEGQEKPHDSTNDVCIPETASPDNEEDNIENSMGAKDNTGKPLVTALIDERSSQNAGLDVGGNLEENPSITFEERSKETVKSIEKKQLTSTEDDIGEKSNLETSSENKMEDMCFQKVDKPEIFKEASETGSEDIVKESQNELQNQSGIAKVDGSFMKLEGSIHREGEAMAPTEASTREYSNDEGFTVVVGKNKFEVEEHSRSEISKHEGHQQQSLLKSEPGKGNPESPPLDAASEEIETTTSDEHAETITHVEDQIDSLEETRKCKTINADDVNNEEIQEEKTLSTVDLDEKPVSAEVEIPNKNANYLNVTHPLVEETTEVGGEQQDKVSTTEFEGQVLEADGLPTEEEKHANEAYEVSKSAECSILEHTSTEEAPATELTTEASEMEVDNFEKVYRLNSEEKLQVVDAGDNIIEEIHHKEEASDTESQRITGKSDATKKSAMKEEVSVKDSNTIGTGEEADQQNCRGDENERNNSEETTSEINGGDQSCRTDNEMGNIYDRIINEEVYEGPKIAEMEEGTEKKIKYEERAITDHSTESTGEEKTKHFQEDEAEAEKSKAEMEKEHETTMADEGKGIKEQAVPEKNRIQDQPMVSTEEETNAEGSKEDEMMATMPKQEVLDTTNTGKDFLEHIVKEVGATNDHSIGSFEEISIQESSQEDEAKEGFETAGTSTNTERQNMEESVIIDHPTITVGEEKFEEVKVLNKECIEQNPEATHPIEETKLEAAKDEADANKNCYAQNTTGMSEEETMPNESNRDLIENFSIPEPDMSEKEIKEEILDKAESTKETSLKESEAEDMQVDSSDLGSEEINLASDRPTLIVGEEKAEEQGKEMNIECIEQKLEVTHSKEEAELATKDEAETNKDYYAQSTTGTSEEETMLNDGNKDPIDNPSVPEPEESEKEIKEEILKKAESTEETSSKEAEAEYKMQVVSSDLAYEKTNMASDNPILTVGEEKVEEQVKELNIEGIEQNLEATHPVEETKLLATKDEVDPNKGYYAQNTTGTSEEETMPNERNRDIILNSSITEPEVFEKEINEEILGKAAPRKETSLKEAEAEYKMQEDSSYRGSEETNLASDHTTLTTGEEKIEEKGRELNIECIKQNLGDTHPIEETKHEATKDEAEPNKDCYVESTTGTSEEETTPNDGNKDPIDNPSVPEPEESEKEIKEDILEKTESTEETSSKEAEAEYKMQVDSSDLAYEETNMASDHPTLTVGEEKVEEQVKELNIEGIEQNLEATHPVEETKLLATKDEVDPNKDYYAQNISGTSEEETLPKECNRDIIENSSVTEPEVFEKEINKEILEKAATTEETSSKDAEAEYTMQADSSDMASEETNLASDHTTLTTGEEKIEEKGKELNIECIEQKLGDTHPIEETKHEATKDEAEPNKDCYAQSTTGTSEEETMPNYSNKDLIDNPSVPEPEVSQKEIKEEILEKAESTEETSSKEVEAEYKMQVDSSDLAYEETNMASDHPILTVGEEKVEEQVKELNIEGIEQNLEATHLAEETKLVATKDEVDPNKDYYAQSTTGTSEDETMPNECNRDIIENSSITEPEVFEKEINEEILEKAVPTKETSSKEAEAEYKMQEDSSDRASEETNLASDHTTLTTGEEKIEEKGKELNIECIEQNLGDTHPIEETKHEATKDEAEPNKDCYVQSTTGTSEEETTPNDGNKDPIDNPSVPEPEESEKEIKEDILEKTESTEETSSKEAEAEYKMQVDSSDLAYEETNMASDHPTLTVGEEKVEEQVKELNIEGIEQNLEATHPVEETKLLATKDEVDPNKDYYAQNISGTSEEETLPKECNRDIIENSSVTEPEVFEKEINKEILEKAATTEETSSKDAEAEYTMQADSSDMASEETNLASDHTTLTTGEEKIEEKGKELNIECIEQNLGDTHPIEETKHEATKNEAEPNKDCYVESTTGTSEEETMPNDGNKDLIDNPSVPEPEVSQKEIKEEILEKAESTEETSSKEAEAEDKMQVDSSDLAYEETNMASDHPILTVGEEKFEEQVKELNIEGIEQNLEATHPVEETKLLATKDEVDPNKGYYAQNTTGTSEEETMPNERNRDIILNSSITEPEVFEKEINEEILGKAAPRKETSLKEAEAEYKMQEDSSYRGSEETNLASDHTTLTTGEEKIEEKGRELNIECIKQNLGDTHPIEETKHEATKDEAEPNKDCYVESTTGTSEEETTPNDGNKDPIDNPSVPEPEESEKEIKEEILEKAESTEEISSKEAEAEHKMQVDSYDLAYVETNMASDHPTLTVGEEKVEEQVKELNIGCIEQNLEATHPVEETKLIATKDEVDPNKDYYAQNISGTSEEETLPKECNRDITENFSVTEPEVFEKEINEEILEKAATTEETSSKDAEAEYMMQADSSDMASEETNLASDHTTLTTGEEKIEEKGKELNIECIEQNLGDTHPIDETKHEATKHEAEPNKDCYAQSTTGTSEEETMPNDGNKDLIDNPSVPEPEESEKEIKEEILEKAESTEETSSKEAEAEYKMQVDSSDLTYEETNMASDHPILTVGEEKVEEQVKELNIGCIEQNLEATHPVEETKLVATKDEVDPNKDYYAPNTSGTSEEETMPNECNRDVIENSSVTKPEVSEKEILERAESTEETSSKEAETEYKMQVDSSDLASDETNLVSDHPTLIFGEEMFKEQVKELNTERIEQNLEATHPTEETKLDASKDEAEPNKYCYAQNKTVRSEDEAVPNEGNRDLIANYSIPEPEYEVSEKEIREEILEKVESTEGTSLKEDETEYKINVDSSHLASEQKVLVTTETSETGSDGVDITAKPTETSELGGNQDLENITVRKHETGGAGENMEHQAQSETHFTMSQREDQREVATGETPLDDILEPSLKASSTLSLKEHNLVTTKMSETTHETLEKDGALYVKAETSLVVEVSEEKLMQKEEMSTNPRDEADMRSEDIGKESENEVVQDKDQELFMPPQADNERSIFESDEKLGNEIGKLETLQDDKSLDIGLEMDKPEDVKPVDEASECAEACGTCADTEKDILEKEHSVNNFEGSLKEGVEIEKAISESEAGGQSRGSEAESTATQENLESVEPAEGFKCAPDSLPEDQSNKRFPQNKTKIEEESDNIKEQNTDSTEEQIIGQDFQECKKMDEEMEPKLEAGDQINNTHDENVTLKDMILNEKVPEEVEKADKTENIKEQIIEEESCTKELHTISKVEDQDLEPNKNLEATYSNMDTETLNSKVAEDLNWEAEASSMTKALEEEEKKAIQKPVDVTSLISEVFSRRNQIDSTLTVVTEETSLGEVQQDKSVKAFDTSTDTKGQETIETTDTSPQGEEVDSVKREEVFGMVSQLPKIEDGNAPEKTVNLRKPDAEANILEVEQTKTSDVLSDSKCQCVEEIHETGTSLIAGITDTDEIKEEIKEGPETISKPKCEAEKIAEQLQMPAFALPEIDSRKLEETSGMMPQIQTIEPENGATESVIVEKYDADEVEETDSFDALHESKDLGVEEIHDSETSPAVRKIDSEKLEELLNEVPETISESRYQGVEAVTDGETPPDQTLPAVRLEEQLQLSPTALLSKEQDHVTTTTIQKIEDETVVDSIKLEETSGIVSQLPTTEWENVDSVSVTVDKLDANDIEVEETKTSDAECKTKDWGVEIHETGTSPAMGKTDTDEMEEEIKEVPETISEPKYQSVEAITDKKITLDQTLPANKLEDQLQVPSHDLLSREHDYRTKTITEKVGDESTNKDETEVNSTKLEETSVMVSQLPTLQRENADGVNVTVAKLNVDDIEVEETITSDVVCESKDQEGIEEIQETGTSRAVGKTDKDEIKEEIKEFPKKISEPIDTEEIQETKISDALCESEDQGVEEIQETGTSPAVGKTDKDEMKEEIKEFPKTISEPIDTEEIEETNISEALSGSEDKGVEEIHETCTSPTVGKTDREKKEGEIKEVPETISEPRYQGVEAVTDGESILDRTLPAGISEEKLQVQSSPLLSREQDHETTTITEKMGESTKKDETEVESMKLEETYAIMSRLPTIEQENDKVVIVEKLDPDEVEETKILETLCESKDREIEEIHETGTSSTVGKICTDEMEEKIKEVPQTISEPGYQAVEAVPYGETTPDQTLPAGILEEKLQVSSSTLLSEQEDEIKTATEKIKDESTNKDDNQVNKNLINSFATSTTEETCLQKEELRELEVSKAELKLIEGIQKESPKEASEEKSTALEKNSAIEPQEYALEIKYDDSPSECEERPIQCNSPGTSKDENILDSGNSVKEVDNLPIPHSTVKENLPQDVDKKCEGSSNIEFEKTGKVLASASDVDSPEVFPEETKIKEEKLKAAITELRAKEDQNEEMNEADKTMKNENSSEEITEERDVAKDSHLVSPNEEIVAKCKDELKTEKYPGPREKTNETTEITNRIPNEELPQELEKTGVYENIKEMGDDRTVKVTRQVSVEDGAATENLPEEAEEGKKVEKASIEFNLGNQSDETKCRDTVTAAMAPSEEGSTEVNSQVTKHFTEEGELMVSKQELQMENAETAQVEEAKTDEEEERDEHKKEDSGSDAPVMVEASRDMDVKIAQKKSHSILSGVGSKVKHSIAKVKKAIIGKSAHSKLPK